MSRAPDKDVSEGDARTDEPAGKVEFDSRGKAIWRWAREKLDSTSVLLKRLDNKNLALEPTQKVPVMRGNPPPGKTPPGKRAPPAPQPAEAKGRQFAAGDPRAAFGRHTRRDGGGGGGGGGFDPYNSR